MHYLHVAAMDSNGLASDGKPSAAPNNADLRNEVFKAEVGDIGDPFQSKDGHAFAIKVNGVTPPTLRPLDAVRAQALAQWTSEQRTAQLRAKAQALAGDAGRLQDLSAAARSIGAKVQASPALTRGTQTDTFSKSLVDAVFAAKFGGVASGPLGKGDGAI